MLAKFRFLRVFLIFLLMALCFALGLFFGSNWETMTKKEAKAFREVRSGGYKLTKPLLECESSQAAMINHELRPFQYKVKSLIDRIIANRQAGAVSVYYRDLNSGQWFGINDDEKFAPASLLKVPIMISYFKWAETNPKVLQRKIFYSGKNDTTKNQNIKPLHTLEPGKSYTIDDLIFRMIAYSDNNAHQLLLDNLPIDSFLMTFKDLYVDLYPDFDPTAIKSDIMSVAAYASFFRVLYNASYLNKAMSEKALNYLAYIDFKEGIVAGVPPNIVVASKFGERVIEEPGSKNDIKELHEVGIIYYPNRPILLGIMTRGEDFALLANVIRDITLLTYGEVEHQLRDAKQN